MSQLHFIFVFLFIIYIYMVYIYSMYIYIYIYYSIYIVSHSLYADANFSPQYSVFYDLLMIFVIVECVFYVEDFLLYYDWCLLCFMGSVLLSICILTI